MIPLTRLNHQGLILNADLIKTIEQPHDTVVTLVNGEKLMVEEAPDEIVRRVVTYRRQSQDPALEAAALVGRGGARYGSR